MATAVARLDVDGVADDELAVMVVATEALLNAVHAWSAVVLAEFGRRGTWADDGALSGTSWAADRTGAAKPSLRCRARAGLALRELPCVAAAAREGRLSPDHVGAVSQCARRHPELAARDEALLLTQAEELDAGAFRMATRHWLDRAADVDAPDPSPGPAPVGYLHASRTLDDWLKLDGLLAPDQADLVEAALGAEVDRLLRAQRDGDLSVPAAQASVLRAEALVDLCAQSMRREPSDASAPDRYRVAVTVPFDITEPPMECCDSTAYRVVLGAEGEVLDVGREQQRWPSGIRRAITHRDKGCVFTGCDRPRSWTDIHHCTPWSEGGTTSVDNGALLCRRHHVFIHKRRWRVSVEEGKAVTRRPDGCEHHVTRWDTTPPTART